MAFLVIILGVRRLLGFCARICVYMDKFGNGNFLVLDLEGSYNTIDLYYFWQVGKQECGGKT